MVKAKGSAGFTVVELLAIISILGILAGLSLPRFNDHLAKSRTTRAAADMRILQNAVDIYLIMNQVPTEAVGGDKAASAKLWQTLKAKGLLGGIPVAVKGGYYKASTNTIVELNDPYYGFDSSSGSVSFGTGSKTITFDEYIDEYLSTKVELPEGGG